jgi:prepilin-type N-terminal cleavage/methylation domain-containing protein
VSRGFSLVEVILVTAILTTGILSVAQLSLFAIRANRLARSATFATMLASEKMEQLRAMTWSFDAAETPGTAPTALAVSPSGTLTENVAGYCDFLDANGRSLGGGSTPPAAAAFVRRWSIDPLPLASSDGLVIQVAVVPVADSRSRSDSPRRFGETRIVGVRSRRDG